MNEPAAPSFDPAISAFDAGGGEQGRFGLGPFRRPGELAAEARDAGLASVRILGIEGPGWILKDFDARWAAITDRERLVGAARAMEKEPSIVGLSAHLLAGGTRPEGDQ
jgi:hypothetical protein